MQKKITSFIFKRIIYNILKKLIICLVNVFNKFNGNKLIKKRLFANYGPR